MSDTILNYSQLFSGPKVIQGVITHSWAGITHPESVKQGRKAGTNPPRNVRNRLRIRGVLRVVALLRCLFQNRKVANIPSQVMNGNQELGEESSLRRVVNNPQIPPYRAQGRHIHHPTVKRVIDGRWERCTFINDRMAGGMEPSLRNMPHPKGMQGRDPSSIQSFTSLVWKERSNHARSLPTNLNRINNFNPQGGLHPGVSSLLSPGLCHPATSALACTTSGDACMRMVYPGWYRVVYTQGCT